VQWRNRGAWVGEVDGEGGLLGEGGGGEEEEKKNGGWGAGIHALDCIGVEGAGAGDERRKKGRQERMSAPPLRMFNGRYVGRSIAWRRAARSTGLTRWRSKPASLVCCKSTSEPRPLRQMPRTFWRRARIWRRRSVP